MTSINMLRCKVESCATCRCVSVCKYSINMMEYASKLQDIINNHFEMDGSLPIKDLKVTCKHYDPSYITCAPYTPTFPHDTCCGGS